MVTIVIRPRARSDIDKAWDYIAEESELEADSFVERLSEKFKLVAGQPDMGRLREDLMPDLRSFPFERYLIFYIPSADGIDVVRILHSARDIEPQFRS